MLRDQPVLAALWDCREFAGRSGRNADTEDEYRQRAEETGFSSGAWVPVYS